VENVSRRGETKKRRRREFQQEFSENSKTKHDVEIENTIQGIELGVKIKNIIPRNQKEKIVSLASHRLSQIES